MHFWFVTSWFFEMSLIYVVFHVTSYICTVHVSCTTYCCMRMPSCANMQWWAMRSILYADRRVHQLPLFALPSTHALNLLRLHFLLNLVRYVFTSSMQCTHHTNAGSFLESGVFPWKLLFSGFFSSSSSSLIKVKYFLTWLLVCGN